MPASTGSPTIAAGLSNYLTGSLFIRFPFEPTELITTILETVVWCILWVTLAYTWIKWPWTAGMIICHLLVILKAFSYKVFTFSPSTWVLASAGSSRQGQAFRPLAITLFAISSRLMLRNAA